MKILALIIATGALAGAIFFAIYYSSSKEHVMPVHLYKILSSDEWLESQKGDRLKLSWIDETFIHLATDEQLSRVLEKFWGDKPSYVVLTVDPKRFVGHLIHETNPGGTNKYYHLYDGYIPLSVVIDVRVVAK